MNTNGCAADAAPGPTRPPAIISAKSPCAPTSRCRKKKKVEPLPAAEPSGAAGSTLWDWDDALILVCHAGMPIHPEGQTPVHLGFRQPPSVPSKDRLARFILASLESHSVFLEKGLLKLASRPLSMPCLLERLPSFLPDRMTDFIDITVEIAYKFIMHFNGSSRTYDLFWLYRWIEELSRKSPAMTDQIRNNLLAAIRRSDQSARIWQADACAGCLDGMPEESR